MSESRKELAERLILQEAVLKRLQALSRETREQLAATFKPGDAESAYTDDDEPIGRVRMNKGRATWKVTDPAAFLAWTQANRPDCIVTTPHVDPTFEAAVIKAGGEWMNEQTGQVFAPDGLELVTGAPTLTVERKEQADEIAKALLAKSERLALPPF